MKKVAVLVGHRQNVQGAYSPFLKQTEFEFNTQIAKQLKDVADVFYRPDTPNTIEVTRIKEVISQINSSDYDLVIELHFNASGNELAHGCEALYFHNNTKGKALADCFIDKMNELIGIKKRSSTPIYSKEQRGGTFILCNKATAILLEPFFGSNREDCNKISQHIDWYVQILKDLINSV